MRATALEVSPDRALVELRPSWIARLFGARTVRIDLRCDRTRTTSGGLLAEWYSATTLTGLSHLEHGSDIKRALDFRQPEQLPDGLPVAKVLVKDHG